MRKLIRELVWMYVIRRLARRVYRGCEGTAIRASLIGHDTEKAKAYKEAETWFRLTAFYARDSVPEELRLLLHDYAQFSHQQSKPEQNDKVRCE